MERIINWKCDSCSHDNTEYVCSVDGPFLCYICEFCGEEKLPQSAEIENEN